MDEECKNIILHSGDYILIECKGKGITPWGTKICDSECTFQQNCIEKLGIVWIPKGGFKILEQTKPKEKITQ